MALLLASLVIAWGCRHTPRERPDALATGIGRAIDALCDFQVLELSWDVRAYRELYGSWPTSPTQMKQRIRADIADAQFSAVLDNPTLAFAPGTNGSLLVTFEQATDDQDIVPRALIIRQDGTMSERFTIRPLGEQAP